MYLPSIPEAKVLAAEHFHRMKIMDELVLAKKLLSEILSYRTDSDISEAHTIAKIDDYLKDE